MCPPASHPTCEEERELRVIAFETLNDAARIGHAHAVFHHFDVQARRVPSSSPMHARPSSQGDHVCVELTIKQCGEVICRLCGALYNASCPNAGGFSLHPVAGTVKHQR